MFLLLLVLWIIFNGRFTPEILIFGIVISGAVCAFARAFLGYSFKKEFRLLRCLPDFIAYVIVLIIEIIKANMVLVAMIFKGNDALKPAIFHFKTSLTSKLARTILADSITLTPGTITVSLRDDELYVHCLDASMAEGMTDSVFVKRLKKMEAKLHG